MDNLSIQLTPLEVSYKSKDFLQLSCLFKKVAISTGHLLQKRQIKAEPDMVAGKNKFTNGPTFALNKQFELNNTKISLHFMAKKDRNISCIGSTEVDIATLPAQRETFIDLHLNNCIYPQGKIKLQIKRKQESVELHKNNRVKPQEMGLLQTEGQRKQELLIQRRANPNIPTAYQISRKNYKQVQTSSLETSRSGGKDRGSGSKGSYQKRFQGTSTISSTSRVKIVASNKMKSKNKDQSPKPRERTPEPIRLKQVLKPGFVVDNKQPFSRYAIGGLGKKDIDKTQQIEMPCRLIVKPYQCNTEKSSSKQNTVSLSEKLSYSDLEIQKKNKYLDITEKLQLIQDRIIGTQDKKYKTETRSIYEKNTELNSNFQFEIQNTEKPMMHKSQKQINAENCEQPKFQSSMVEQRFDPNKIESTKQNLVQQNVNMKKQFKNNSEVVKQQQINHVIIRKGNQIKQKSQQSPLINSQLISSKDSKITNLQNQIQRQRNIFKKQIQNFEKDNSDLSRENEIIRAKLLDSQTTVKKLMIELQQYVAINGQKDKRINGITKQLNEANKQVNEGKTKEEQNKKLLAKLMKQFQQKQDQVVYLEDQISVLKKTIQKQNKAKSSMNAQYKESPKSGDSQKSTANKEELQQCKTKLTVANRSLLDTQSLLRLKENQIKHLKLQIKNSFEQKKQLQQELRVIASSNKQQMGRQKSLAHINQISNTSLAQQTKRQNQTLKNEVKILQQKLSSLNKLIESLISKDNALSASKVTMLANTLNDTQFENRQKIKELLQKCTFLQQELRVKKNLMAEIINIIWNEADPKLMESIQQFMGQ